MDPPHRLPSFYPMGYLPIFATNVRLVNPAFACLWKFRSQIPVEPALNFRLTSLLFISRPSPIAHIPRHRTGAASQLKHDGGDFEDGPLPFATDDGKSEPPRLSAAPTAAEWVGISPTLCCQISRLTPDQQRDPQVGSPRKSGPRRRGRPMVSCAGEWLFYHPGGG